DAPSPAARRLRLRIRLAAGERQAVLEEALSWAESADGAAARTAWAMVARAARALERSQPELRALEALLAGTEGEQRGVRVERAWEAYLARGERLGNQANLLVGEDGQWLRLAREKSAGVDRRALLASVALLGRSAETRQDARQAFIQALAEAERPGTALALFRHGPAFAEADALSSPAEVQLGRLALRTDRYPAAHYWLERVEGLPSSVKPGPWHLMRGRLAVRLGEFATGEAQLAQLLERPALFAEAGFRDRFLQVVFDLQEQEAYDRALRLLSGLHEVVEDPGARREILFWQAECREGLGAHRRAATLYLRSAAHPAGEAGDPWSRTARFRAAGALAKTAYTADARRIYRALLGGGSGEQRVAIERRLRRLGSE
ncbi:MAG TPA: hypothetical protein VJ985_06630, partial [Gammaproteobacteria bacterium]|nr:hypothetical protein [Gammaproteobacteria bacterium]